ncbi:MAG TPA: thiamine pyrophosphate-requiring protein [Firmicutes bacterium]|nr:thiamine pyrophosphate-requiring protein [Bacillota bacterium]
MGNNREGDRYTAADALTDALVNAGVSYIFVNSGTDYPPIIENWAKYEQYGRPKPEIIVCPHEMVALSAAQGYAQATGKGQAVFVHVDVGTQNLGGSVHNACRCRVPAFILAGVSPFTLEGELKGTRNAHIQFLQNVHDQAAIVREYTKWYYEVRTGKNIQQLVYRGLQIAHSAPQGPVYLMAAREPLEEEGRDIGADPGKWAAIAPQGLSDEGAEQIANALLAADNPVIITSYAGRNPECVAELVALSERLAIPVVEAGAINMNFPADHPLHVGHDPKYYLQTADVILVLDSDLPWIPALTGPHAGAKIFYVDVDPLKEGTPLWYIPADGFFKADSLTALKQINSRLAQAKLPDPALLEKRLAAATAAHQALLAAMEQEEQPGDKMTPEFVAATLRQVLADDDIVLDETTSYHSVIEKHLPRNKPGTYFMSGGSALGWFGGAAIGVKLACPEKNVVALCGDGTYIFSVPTATYWVAAKYKTPFMTVIFNNQGWGAAKLAVMREHPDGYAARNDTFWTAMMPAAHLEKVAEAAGGAFARAVSDPGELKSVLQEGMEAVRSGRCAVINVLLPPVSRQ